MDQGKLRGPVRLRAQQDSADFGEEPPLSVDGGNAGFVDRRRVSVQWFSGTVLTGLCGAALMGGAVYAALDGDTTFGAVPERIEAASKYRYRVRRFSRYCAVPSAELISTRPLLAQ